MFEKQIFGVGEIDYIESFSDVFTTLSLMRKKELIDKDGNLLVDIDNVGNVVPEFDELFDTDEEYYETLLVIKEIIDKYSNKI